MTTGHSSAQFATPTPRGRALMIEFLDQTTFVGTAFRDAAVLRDRLAESTPRIRVDDVREVFDKAVAYAEDVLNGDA